MDESVKIRKLNHEMRPYVIFLLYIVDEKQEEMITNSLKALIMKLKEKILSLRLMYSKY